MHTKIRFDEFLQGESIPQRFEQMSAEDVLGLLKNHIEFPTRAPTPQGFEPVSFKDTIPDTIPAGVLWDARLEAYRPQSVQQVQKLVARARAYRVKVRTSGSRHSMERAYACDGLGDLNLLLDGELRKVEFLEKNDQFARVRVGAGCYIGPNPSDKSLPEAATLSRLLDKEGYALPLVGGITHQSVGGFMQTGSSGGSLQHGFADVVEEIELVDGKGDVRTFKKGSDEFNAIGVSMGLLGVITHVTLRVPRTYWVEGLEETVDHRDSLLTPNGRGGFRLTEALASTEYLHLNWFPQKYVRRVMQWSGRQVRPDPGKRQPYENILKDWLISSLGQGVLCTVDRLLQQRPVSNGTNLLIGDLMRRFVGIESRPFRDSWYKTLPSDDQVRVDGGMKTFFTELWLPVEATDRLLPLLENMFRDPVVAGNFAVELYGAKSSPFWLSPAHGRNVVRVDPYWWASNKGRPEQYFVHFWNQLMDVEGTRFHWGKYMPAPGQKCGNSRFDRGYLEKVYPRLGDWLELRRQMDPENVFLTNYWRDIFDIR